MNALLRRMTPARSIEAVLALLVLVHLWIAVWRSAMWYPSWLYLGPVTLDWSILPPIFFGGAVLARVIHQFRTGPALAMTDVGETVLAILTVLGGVYALLTLNLASPGVFFAAVFPVGFGALLGVLAVGSYGFAWAAE